MSRFWRVVLLGVVAIVLVELARYGLRAHFGWRTPLPGADWAVYLLVGFGAAAPPRLRASAAAGTLVAGTAALLRLAVAPVPAWTAPWLAFLALVTGGLMLTGASCGLLGGLEARRRARPSRSADPRTLVVLLVLALAAPRASLAQTSRDTALANAILAHGRADQAIRDSVIERLQAGQPLDSLLVARQDSTDAANTAWLKSVIARHGWPGRSLVGAEASHAAFLIVQHATHDTAFMAHALGLMERAVPAGDARGDDVAMLADRIAIHRGQLQRYGTQAKIENGRVTLDPIADSAHVDERRAALGMVPLAEYVRMLDSLYTAQAKPR